MSKTIPLSRRLLAALCAASLLVPAAPLRAQNNLPALGDAATEDFGVATERRVGEQIMREIRRDPDYLHDPLLLEYLQSLCQPLVAAARARGEIGADVDSQFAWEVFLVRDRNVNAFALPGGWVGVYLGLIALTQTRDELASMAFWGAPVPDPEHALNACRAAVKMQERLISLRQEMKTEDMPEISSGLGLIPAQ